RGRGQGDGVAPTPPLNPEESVTRTDPSPCPLPTAWGEGSIYRPLQRHLRRYPLIAALDGDAPAVAGGGQQGLQALHRGHRLAVDRADQVAGLDADIIGQALAQFGHQHPAAADGEWIDT